MTPTGLVWFVTGRAYLSGERVLSVRYCARKSIAIYSFPSDCLIRTVTACLSVSLPVSLPESKRSKGGAFVWDVSVWNFLTSKQTNKLVHGSKNDGRWTSPSHLQRSTTGNGWCTYHKCAPIHLVDTHSSRRTVCHRYRKHHPLWSHVTSLFTVPCRSWMRQLLYTDDNQTGIQCALLNILCNASGRIVYNRMKYWNVNFFKLNQLHQSRTYESR